MECDKVAQHLRDKGIKAEAYHAGLSDTQRNNVQQRWIREDACKVCILSTVSVVTGVFSLPGCEQFTLFSRDKFYVTDDGEVLQCSVMLW